MSVYGVGIDVLRVRRIETVYKRHGRRFVDRLLHPRERAGFELARQPAQHLAKCFAAKEAFVKALGTGFRGVTHDDVGVLRDGLGRPEFVFSRRLATRLRKLKSRRAHLSLSDEGGMVGAFAVLER